MKIHIFILFSFLVKKSNKNIRKQNQNKNQPDVLFNTKRKRKSKHKKGKRKKKEKKENNKKKVPLLRILGCLQTQNSNVFIKSLIQAANEVIFLESNRVLFS